MLFDTRLSASLAALSLALVPLFAAPGEATLPAQTVLHSGSPEISDVTRCGVSRQGVIYVGAIAAGVPSGESCRVFRSEGGLATLHSQSWEPLPALGPGVERGCPSGVGIEPDRVLGSISLAGDGIDSSNDSAVAIVSSAGTTIVVREGDPAPGALPGTDIGFIYSGSYAFTGTHLAFHSSLSGSETGRGLFAGSAPDASLVAQTASSGDIGFFLGSPRVGIDGAVTFRAVSADGLSESVRLATASRGASVVAQSGDAAPGTAAAFEEFLQPELSDPSVVTFWSRLTNADAGIWSGSPGSLRKVVVTGDPVGRGAVVSGVGGAFSVSTNGLVAFVGTSDGHDGIWVERSPGVFERVVHGTDAVPGLPTLAFAEFRRFMLDATGRVTFKAMLSGPGVSSGSDESLWTSLADGTLLLVAREGDTLQVAGAPRTVSGTLDFCDAASSVGGGRGSSVTDQGQVVYLARFSDNTRGVLSVFPDGGRPGLVFWDGFEGGDAASWGAPQR